MKLIRRLLGQDLRTQIISVILLIPLLYLAIQALTWGITDAHWQGSTREACNGHDGACWVYVKEHLGQFLYGAFFPKSEIWRVNLLGVFALVLVVLAIRGIKRSLNLIGLTLGIPLVAIVLLHPISSSEIGGLTLTLIIAYVGILGSLPLGILLALGRRSKLPIFRWLSIGFIELWRGVPLISVLFMSSVMLPLFLPKGMEAESFPKLLRCLIGVTLFSGAYMAEVVRGGLQTIPTGQSEAAHALGLSYRQSMTYLILPQALRAVVPGIVNNFISLFKDTTLVMIIGMFDLLGAIQASLADSDWLGYNLEGYVFAAAIFWIFCFGLSRASRRSDIGFSAQ